MLEKDSFGGVSVLVGQHLLEVDGVEEFEMRRAGEGGMRSEQSRRCAVCVGVGWA